MTELPNSRRVVHKATHVAVIPDVGGEDTVAAASVSGAIAKTGQIQLLSIKKAELPALRTGIRELGLRRKQALAVRKALRAVGMLVADDSRQAVLQHAQAFARVDKSALKQVADVIIANRQQRHAELLNTLGKIRKDYVTSAATPAAAASVKASFASAAPSSNLLLTAEKAKLFGSILASNSKLRALAKSSGPAAAFESLSGRNLKSSPQAPPAPATSRSELQTLNDAIRWAAENKNADYLTLRKLLPPKPIALKSNRSFHDDYTGTDVVDAVSDAANEAAATNAFSQTFHIEPVGRLFLERIETTPAGIERGELVYSIPMTPGEEVNISHREWSQQSEGFENIVNDQLEGYSEKGVSEKSDVSQAMNTESKHSTALNVGVSLSASYASVSLSSSFGYNATSDDQQSKKDSRNHTSEVTSKAAARTRKDHKVTFKVASAVETEDLAVRKIKNEGTTAVRYDYYRMMRKWKVDLIRYGLLMTYDIVIPSPGSALLQKIAQKKQIDARLNEPLKFGLTPTGITRENWVDLQAQWGAPIAPPPEETMVVDQAKPF